VFVQVKWYKSKHVVNDDGEDTASDDNSSRKRSRKGGNHADSMLFKTGALISIIGEGGEATAHGVMEDAEPDVSHQKRCQQYGSGIGYWRRIFPHLGRSRVGEYRPRGISSLLSDPFPLPPHGLLPFISLA
jgi:hypothetical protein